MADDVVTLLDYIGWKEKRQIHVVGVSLGGMIAQGSMCKHLPAWKLILMRLPEVASKIPERIVSLSLIVTKAGRRRLVELPSVSPLQLSAGYASNCTTLLVRQYIGLKNLMRTMMIKEPEKKIPYVLEMLYPKEWLDAKAPSDPEGRTNREIETLVWTRLLDLYADALSSNAQAYKKRIEVTRPQTFLGAISQMAAAMTHHVSPDRLRKISSAIPKVIIVTGDTDNLIDPSNSHFLKEHMPEAELVVKTGVAHGLTIQEKQWFNELLERTFKEGRERAK